jgi:hypothetical protein
VKSGGNPGTNPQAPRRKNNRNNDAKMFLVIFSRVGSPHVVAIDGVAAMKAGR